MKYKNIVLCGVDLSNSNFFYFDKKYDNRLKPEKDLIEDNIHPTNQDQKTNIPISDIIEILHDELFAKDNIRILVGSKKSALYPQFDYCFEKINEKRE